MITTPIHRRATWLGLIASTVLTTSTVADVNGNWVSETEFTISLSHMPDFDQIRATGPGILGLPNDGNMYCVPTSVLNLGAYIARHGHPDALPGDENWQSQANYNDATFALAVLGIIGNTTPEGGTGLSGMRLQAEATVPLDRFTVSTHGFSGSTFADVPDMARWVRDGSLVSFCHGWYDQIGTINELPNLDRIGGHCVTFQAAGRSIFDRFLAVRDPADSTIGLTQSPFTSRVYDWEKQLMYFNGTIKLGTRIEPLGGDDTIWRVIDGYCKITPKMGVSLVEPDVAMVAVASATFGFTVAPIELDAPDESVIEAAAFGPDNDRLYAIVRRADGSLVPACTQLRDPEWTLFEDIPLPGPGPVIFGDDRSMYTIGGGQVLRILVDVSDGALPEVIGSRNVGQFASIAFDAATDRVVLLDPEALALQFLPDHLDGDVASFEIPIFIDPESKMTWDVTRGCAWVSKPGSDTLLKLTPSPFTGVVEVDDLVIPNGISVADVDVDDQGHLLVTDGEKWYEFAQDDAGDWSAVEDSFAHGLTVGRSPRISRSITNWTAEDFPAEAWVNVLPESFGPGIIDCPADLDADGVIGFSDLLVVLAAWGPCPAGAFCDADLDASGAVDFSDLLEILAAFGDCPGFG